MTCAAGDWDRGALLANPAFESLWPAIALCPAGRFPGIDDLSGLAQMCCLTSGGGAALRFVSGDDSAHGVFDRQYEVRIYRDGEVPTRSGNVHDLFNALVWLGFPRTKAQLNRRHYESLMTRPGEQGAAGADSGSRGTPRAADRSRGTPRDVLTLFDESGVIVACSEPELTGLLEGFEWKALFWSRRAEVQRAMRFFLFGHGIHEKALRPFKGITAKALVLAVSPGFCSMPLDLQLAEADERAAQWFSQPLGSTRMFAPLPILGVPGWEAANERESFYEDAAVFRPGRSSGRWK